MLGLRSPGQRVRIKRNRFMVSLAVRDAVVTGTTRSEFTTAMGGKYGLQVQRRLQTPLPFAFNMEDGKVVAKPWPTADQSGPPDPPGESTLEELRRQERDLADGRAIPAATLARHRRKRTRRLIRPIASVLLGGAAIAGAVSLEAAQTSFPFLNLSGIDITAPLDWHRDWNRFLLGAGSALAFAAVLYILARAVVKGVASIRESAAKATWRTIALRGLLPLAALVAMVLSAFSLAALRSQLGQGIIEYMAAVQGQSARPGMSTPIFILLILLLPIGAALVEHSLRGIWSAASNQGGSDDEEQAQAERNREIVERLRADVAAARDGLQAGQEGLQAAEARFRSMVERAGERARRARQVAEAEGRLIMALVSEMRAVLQLDYYAFTLAARERGREDLLN